MVLMPNSLSIACPTRATPERDIFWFHPPRGGMGVAFFFYVGGLISRVSAIFWGKGVPSFGVFLCFWGVFCVLLGVLLICGFFCISRLSAILGGGFLYFSAGELAKPGIPALSHPIPGLKNRFSASVLFPGLWV